MCNVLCTSEYRTLSVSYLIDRGSMNPPLMYLTWKQRQNRDTALETRHLSLATMISGRLVFQKTA